MAAKKPIHPPRHIKRAALGALKLFVVGTLLLLHLGGKRIEPHLRLLALREQIFRERPCQPAVAIVERMQSQKPQMRNGRFYKPWHDIARFIHKVEKMRNLVGESIGSRRNKMNALHHAMARHNAHWPIGVVAKRPDRYLYESRITSGEKRRMPRKKPRRSHRLLPIARCVKHHVRPRLGFVRHGALRGGKRNLHAPGDARAHVVAVQPLALYRGGIQYFRGKHLAHRLVLDVEADGIETSEELAKRKRRFGKLRLNLRSRPPELRPVL